MQVNDYFRILSPLPASSIPGTNATFSNTRAGWTAGGGIEYAVTDNWWVRAEYRYSNFGHTADFPFAGALPFADSFVSLRHHLTENQVQAGLSYRFDWTVPGPAVASGPAVPPGPIAAPAPAFVTPPGPGPTRY